MDFLKNQKGNSIIRAFHASPSLPEIDIYIDGKLIFEKLPFSNFSDYTYLKNGPHTIQVTPAGNSSKVLLDKTIDIPEGKIFTLSTIGNLENLEPLLIEDGINEVPSTKESTFRVLNLSPNAPNVDVVANDNVLFKNVAFKENTDYIKVPSGLYDLNFTFPEKKDIVLSSKLNLKANRIYTLFLIGNIPELGLIQSVDANTYLCN